ncbi:MAG: hypothetical protein RBT11_19590 [Desulfobacterales bacterium]|jgi:hypothetical protein|nr:hypothetical protein [Desulfobacterales bacterium]
MAMWRNDTSIAYKVESVVNGNAVLVDVLPGGSVLAYNDLSVDGFTNTDNGVVVKKIDDGVLCEAVIIGLATGNGSFVVPEIKSLLGKYIQKIITTPGADAAEPAAYTISVADSTGAVIFTVAARSTTVTERYDVPKNLGYNEVLDKPWTVTLTGLGEGNTASVRLIFN